MGVLEVEDDFFYQTRDQLEFSLTRRLEGYRIQRTSRATIAGLIIITMIVLVAFNVMSMLNAALLGGLALLLTGSMTPRIGWRSIEWDTVVILGAAVGLSTAVTATGLSDIIAQGLTAIGGSNPYIALEMVFFGCILLTNIITNAAAASIMFPVALSLSTSLGVSFTPFAVVLMLGTSTLISCWLPNQPDGPGTREIHILGFCETRNPFNDSGRHHRIAIDAPDLSILVPQG